jgi:hypothetical protein
MGALPPIPLEAPQAISANQNQAQMQKTHLGVTGDGFSLGKLKCKKAANLGPLRQEVRHHQVVWEMRCCCDMCEGVSPGPGQGVK